MFYRYECGYGPENHHEDSKHIKSIKCDCLAHVFIKRFYTRPDVVEIIFLPSNSYSGQWRSYSWCMWPRVHITDVGICSTHVSQVEGVYMDPIRVKVHCERNLWQAQINLVGTSEYRWMDDPWWFPMTPRYHLLGLKTQEGHLMLTHKLSAFHSVMGLCSCWWYFLFLRCRWSEWDSCPFHHKDLDTYAVSSHAPLLQNVGAIH
jgi:hypothetical protein